MAGPDLYSGLGMLDIVKVLHLNVRLVQDDKGKCLKEESEESLKYSKTT